MNKEKGQRGTSAHEDNIDMSITLDRPLDYQPENGADFILSFSKARVPYEDLTHLQQTHFTLKPDRDGHMIWEHSNVKAETKNAVLQMLDQGFSPKDIMAALSISKGRITQIKQDAIKKGIMTREGKIIGSNF
jgi:DNA-directed RNA polymerase specialized sigma subunit